MEEYLTNLGNPTGIRAFREHLNLSRRDVEQHTGLSSSAVWRAEQDGKQVMPEVSAKIVEFLIAFSNGTIKIEKKQKSKKATPSEATQQLVDEWRNETWKLRGVIDDTLRLLDAEIEAATKAKRSTKGIREIAAQLRIHATD